jgi:UDP-glucose 6-dehydrogenase
MWVSYPVLVSRTSVTMSHALIKIRRKSRRLGAAIPIFEPDLDRLVQTNVKNGRLDVETELTIPVGEADAVFIAVGTASTIRIANALWLAR